MSRISVDVSSARIPVLQVGYQGENEVTDVLFDISSWITEFGEGVAQLRVKRPGNSGEESYVLSLTITDGKAVWTVSETDTANKGNGKVQLSYLVGNIVKKAVIYPYKVGKSIVGADNPVDPFDSWIERSKAWAIGETLDGDAVPETDETYQNNAKYYAEQADILGSAQVVLAAEKVTLAAEQATLATEKADAAAESEAAVNGVSTQLTTRMSAIETEQSVQSARMDNFTSLPEGSTSGNAELADIRVGAYGTTYDTAGNAVRGQIGELKSDLDAIDELLSFLNKNGETYLNTNRYNTIRHGINLQKGKTYRATWTLSEALSDVAYCYLVDADSNNIYPGETSINAGNTTHVVEFTPTQDYNNITANIYVATANPSVLCSFEIVGLSNKIDDIEKITKNVRPSSLKELKYLLPFVVGNLENGKPSTFPYRVSNSQNIMLGEDVIVEMSGGYQCGYVVFQNIEDETSTEWIGWASKIRIPKNTIFKIQLARPLNEEQTGGTITDSYDNDIMNHLSITAIYNFDDNNDFDFGHNGLKSEIFVDYALWPQGVARVKDKLVGFNASNDEHTNTGIYTSMYYENGYAYNARGEHNLGHCASADYCKETDTLIVANGTYVDGVTPTIYFIGNAENITNNGDSIMVTDSNVFAIELTNLDGEGVVCCYGENSSIIYAVTTENASNFSQYGKKYLYKLVLGMGAKNMVSLHPDNSIGTFVSGKSDNEYNGTAYVMKKYIGDYKIELQGMKYHKGRIILSCDTIIDNVQTAYILAIRTVDNDNSFVVENSYWIPSLDTDGNYTRTESEDVVFADGYGYVTIFRNILGDSRTFKFEW